MSPVSIVHRFGRWVVRYDGNPKDQEYSFSVTYLDRILVMGDRFKGEPTIKGSQDFAERECRRALETDPSFFSADVAKDHEEKKAHRAKVLEALECLYLNGEIDSDLVTAEVDRIILEESGL